METNGIIEREMDAHKCFNHRLLGEIEMYFKELGNMSLSSQAMTCYQYDASLKFSIS